MNVLGFFKRSRKLSEAEALVVALRNRNEWLEKQLARRDEEWAGLKAEIKLSDSTLIGLTAAEIERYAFLVEECGDVARTVALAIQYGPDSTGPHTSFSVRQTLEHRIGNLYAAVSEMREAGDVSESSVRYWFARKRHLWRKHSKYQGAEAPVSEAV